MHKTQKYVSAFVQYGIDPIMYLTIGGLACWHNKTIACRYLPYYYGKCATHVKNGSLMVQYRLLHFGPYSSRTSAHTSVSIGGIC